MKQRIIQEIRRIAADDGGRPPGKRMFQRVTGIAEHEWSGKIWTKWSQAIEEAGFIPNEKEQKLPSDLLLEKYAEACRHFGRPPSNPELRLYARQTPGFPSHNTFSNHFGNKNNLVRTLRAWLRSRSGNEDLLEALPEIEASSRQSREALQSQGKHRDGYVYLLKSGDFFKIGRCDEIEKRIKKISIALPQEVTLVHVIRTDDPPGIERYWHQRFVGSRANGEWFKLSASDLRVFKRRKFQ